MKKYSITSKSLALKMLLNLNLKYYQKNVLCIKVFIKVRDKCPLLPYCYIIKLLFTDALLFCFVFFQTIVQTHKLVQFIVF